MKAENGDTYKCKMIFYVNKKLKNVLMTKEKIIDIQDTKKFHYTTKMINLLSL